MLNFQLSVILFIKINMLIFYFIIFYITFWYLNVFCIESKLINDIIQDDSLIKEMLFSSEFAKCLQYSLTKIMTNFYKYLKEKEMIFRLFMYLKILNLWLPLFKFVIKLMFQGGGGVQFQSSKLLKLKLSFTNFLFLYIKLGKFLMGIASML